MRAIGLKLLVFILIICLTVPVLNTYAAEKAVSVLLSCDSDAYYGGEIVVRIVIPKPSVALAGLEFTLAYDPEYVAPQITENSENGREMDQFMVAAPDGWEQYCYHSSESALYQLRFLMPQSGDSYLDQANELILEIPFTVYTPGSFDFSVAENDIIAIGADELFTAYSGNGDTLTVVASGDAEKLSVDLGAETSVPENGKYYLDIAVTNLGDTSGIVAVEFDLAYDKSVFEPVVKDNSQSAMNQFMVSMPENAWEQMCTLYESEGKYTLRFAANNSDTADKAEILASGETLTLSIPFKVIGGEGDVAAFRVDSASVIGLNNVMGIISGRGDSKSVSISEAADLPIENLEYEIVNGYLLYVPEKTNVESFLSAMGSGYGIYSDGKEITSGYVRTGYTLSDNNGTEVIVVVKGDVDKSGVIDFYDCVYIKSIYYEKYTPAQEELYAAAIIDQTTVSLYDYLQVKAHYFGKADINA